MRMCTRLLPVIPALLLTGCVDFGDFGSSENYKEDFHHTYPLAAGGSVSIETFNGSVELMGWEQDTVEVNGTKYAATRSGLDSIRIDVSTPRGSVRLRATKASDFHHNMGARFTVRVPRALSARPCNDDRACQDSLYSRVVGIGQKASHN